MMPNRSLHLLAALVLLAGACSPTDDGAAGPAPTEDVGADTAPMDDTSVDAEAPDVDAADSQDSGRPAVAAVEISPSDPVLELHTSTPLEAQPISVDGNELAARATQWSSSDDVVVSVNQYGTIIANEIGQATITATIEEVSGSTLVTVRGKPVADVELIPAQRTLEPGEQVELTVYLTDANGASIDDDRDIEFSSSATEVATVSENGLVTGLSPGDATITAEVEDEQATMAITVEEAPPSNIDRVELSSNYEQLIRGDTVTLTATVYDDQGGELTGSTVNWSSSSPSVAAVDSGGRVEALGEGSATIVATSGGKSATAVVDVTFSLSTIGVGDGFACGLISGVAFCWGANGRGQLGRGTTSTDEPLGRVSGDHTFDALTVGDTHACGLSSAGEAFCWGAGDDGQLGDGDSDRSSPSPVAGGHTFEALAAGPHHTCGLDQQGDAWCWGLGDNGQLGDGTSSTSSSPVGASGPAFDAIFVGASHTCALTASDDAYCWGANGSGQLGTNDRVEHDEPAAVTGGYSFGALALADAHTCAVGSSSCWGANDRGQLGDGTTNDHVTPLLIPTPVALSRVAAGGEHTCALGGGSVYCWGANDAGQLGTGATAERHEPTQVPSTHTFTDVAAGPASTCALDDAGKPHCWGDLVGQPAPTAIPGF